MILTDREIQIAIEKKHIEIEPLPRVEAYSSTSVDLTLDPHIAVFKDDLINDPVENIIDPGHENFVAEKVLAKLTNQVTIDKNYGFRILKNLH